MAQTTRYHDVLAAAVNLLRANADALSANVGGSVSVRTGNVRLDEIPADGYPFVSVYRLGKRADNIIAMGNVSANNLRLQFDGYVSATDETAADESAEWLAENLESLLRSNKRLGLTGVLPGKLEETQLDTDRFGDAYLAGVRVFFTIPVVAT